MISADMAVFLSTIVCGAAVSVLFDMFRAVRIGVKPPAAVVAATDVLFCAAAAMSFAFCVWQFGSGKFRFYEIIGVFLGVVFYFLLLSRWVLKLFLAITEIISKICGFILKILLTPPRFLYKILVVPKIKTRGRKTS